MVEEASGICARALRVIGQDLAQLVPESLTVEFWDSRFVAHGLCSKSRIEELNASGAWNGMKRLVGKISEIVRLPPHELDFELVPFSRTYSAEEIDHLDAHATHYRGGNAPIGDIYSLAERLRTIGKLIDGENGRIIKIYKDLHHVRFEYRDSAGQRRDQQLSNTELYQLQQRYAGGRSPSGEAKGSSR